MSNEYRIRLANIADLQIIADLQRSESNRVGFLPFDGLREIIESGCSYVAHDANREISGYLLARRKLSSMPWIRPIVSVVVPLDLRRRRIAMMLVLRAVYEAKRDSLDALQAWCREDLVANRMWDRLGFVITAERPPTNARKKAMLLWRFPVTAKGLDRLHEPPKRAGWKAAKVDTQGRFDWLKSALP